MDDKPRIRADKKGLDAGQLEPLIASFELHLAAERKSPRTIRTYTEAARWIAASHLVPAGTTRWDAVAKGDIEAWMAHLNGTYSASYASNQFRALQQFFRWFATEDPDEPKPNPMASLKPPKVVEAAVPVFTAEELARLIATCKGPGYRNKRDDAMLKLFRDTGIRLGEMAGLLLADLNLKARELPVIGKGGKPRTVKYTAVTAVAIDRYLRERAKHKLAGKKELWIGLRGPMTDSGIYQTVEHRGNAARPPVEVFPHKFRHHFSHDWLDRGGAEGDLMELNGWESAQMLRRYGRSAAAARARRHYDHVMGDD